MPRSTLFLSTIAAVAAVMALTSVAEAGQVRRKPARDGMMRLGGPSAAANSNSCQLCNDQKVRAFFLERQRQGEGSPG